MLITSTPNPLNASVYSSSFALSASRCAFKASYLCAIISYSFGTSGSSSYSAGSLYSSPDYIAFLLASYLYLYF